MVADFTGIPWRKLHTEPPEALRADWLGLSWQARGLYALILAAANESGEVLLGRAGLRSVAALVQASWSDIEEPLRELLDSGWAAHHTDRSALGLPYFEVSQKAVTADGLRKQEHRRKEREAREAAAAAAADAAKPDEEKTVCGQSADSLRTGSGPSPDSRPRIENREVRTEKEDLPEVAGKASLAARPVEPVLLPDQPTSKPENSPPRSGPAPDATPRTRASEPEAVEPKQIALLSDADKRLAPPRQKRASDSGRTTVVWLEYARAYAKRYGVEPVRSAKISTALGRIIDAVGLENAIAIAGFFPTHNGSFYVLRGHPIGLLESDAQKLLTEYQTGRRVNAETARRNEKVEANDDVYAAVEARLFGNKSTEPEDIACRADDEDADDDNE